MSVLINPGQSPSALLQKQRVEVSSVGDTVRLTIGNAHIDMPYETALQLAQWLRVQGRRSKARVGDTRRQYSVLGILEDAKL